MSDTLVRAMSALRHVGEMLGEASRRLAPLDPGASTFGASGPGGLGDAGRDVYLQWQRALDARSREAAAHAARLDELGDAVARAEGGYSDVDDSARRQHPEAN